MKRIYSVLYVLAGIVLIFVLSSFAIHSNKSSEFEPPNQKVIVTIYGTSLLEECEDAVIVVTVNGSEADTEEFVQGQSVYDLFVGASNQTRTICTTLLTDCTGFYIEGTCETGVFDGSPDLYLSIRLRKIEN